jgi:hypothetical protein
MSAISPFLRSLIVFSPTGTSRGKSIACVTSMLRYTDFPFSSVLTLGYIVPILGGAIECTWFTVVQCSVFLLVDVLLMYVYGWPEWSL